MDPASPLRIAIGAGTGLSRGSEAPPAELRAGALVSLRVVEDRGGGRYTLALSGRDGSSGSSIKGSGPGAAAGSSIKGSGPEAAAGGEIRLSAYSNRPLSLGDSILARVERRGGEMLLRPLGAGQERAAAAAIARASAGPVDAAMAALLREGISPGPEALERLRRLVGRPVSGKGILDGQDHLALAARLEAAGIPADPELVEAIGAEAEGGQPGSSGSPGSGHPGSPGSGNTGSHPGGYPGSQDGSSSSEGPVSDSPSLDPDHALDIDIPETKLPRLLGSLLKGIAFRSGGEGSSLNLFNHSPGAEGSWAYAPFAFELDSIAFEGTIRVQSPRLRGGPARIEASFLSRRLGGTDPGRRWTLGLDAGARCSLRLGCGDEKAARAARERFSDLRGALAARGRQIEAVFTAAGAAAGRADRMDGEGTLDVQA